MTISGTPTESGSFTYTVTLLGGCGTVTTTGVINVTPDNTISLTSANDNQTVCIGTPIVNITYATTGATDATVTGLPLGVTGSWASDVVTISGTPTEPGSFTYTVTLLGGCGTVTTTGTLIVEQIPTLLITDPAPVCPPATFDLTAPEITTGSTPGLTFTYWTDASATISYPSPAAAVAGTYYIKGETAAGCFDIKPVNAVYAVGPSVIADITNVLCNGGSNGAIDITVSGGTEPFGFLWSNGSINEDISGLTAGIYTIVITDALGCITTESFTVTETAALTVATTQVDVVVYGEATGSATAIPSGGTEPYGYSWNTTPVQTDATATGLAAGTYKVTVTDANGCIAEAEVTITQPAEPLAVAITAQTNVDCFGEASGSATAEATGGAAPYTYTWNTTPVQTGPVALLLPAGTWTVTVTDDAGATETADVTITQPSEALAVTMAKTDVRCNGESNGTATATATGGTAPYTYEWNTVPVQTDAQATGLAAGTYTVTVTDANGCIISGNVTIDEPAALTVAIISQTNVFCFGEATGSAVAEASGGTAPYSYSWNTTPAQTSETATGLVAGAYIVTVTDANGCTATESVTITQPPFGVEVIITSTDALCYGQANGEATAAASGGTAPYSYSWNTTPVQTGATATGLAAGTYTVTVTDADGCTTSGTVTIAEPEAIVLTVAVTDASCPNEANGTINLTISGGTAPYTVIWDDGTMDEDRTSIPDGTYTVIVTDANGCTGNTTVTVGIIGIDCLEIPTVFTPNGDGKNDVWRLINIELYPDAELLVFNRWGRRVYQTKNIATNPWDGKFRGRVLPTDSYHYVLHLNDGTLPRTGVVTILK
ncbi:MAG: gliding motility-associated C-terminal domain-containing protein [Bacteroidales bacterium]|nr:gliding motility-associated C-terminal domain-containing protein [Bacteroidales bacterium]